MTLTQTSLSKFDTMVDIISLIVGVEINDNKYPIPMKLSELRKLRFFMEALETSEIGDIVSEETQLIIDQKAHIQFHGAYNDDGCIGSWSIVVEVL